MMFTTLKSKFAGTRAKVVAGAAIAGAAMLMAIPTAQAQRVRFGVAIGGPVYAAPAPVYAAPAYAGPAYVGPGAEVVFTGPGYYDGIYFRDYNAWHAHYLAIHPYGRGGFYGRDFHRTGRGFYRR